MDNKDVHSFVKKFFGKSSVPFKLPYDAEYYSARLSHYIHYDQQMWSRIQTLLVVEGAVLMSSYALLYICPRYLSPIIMLFGILLVIIIALLIKRDEENRDFNFEFFDSVRKNVISPYVLTLQRHFINFLL